MRKEIMYIHRDIMRRCYDEKYLIYSSYGAIGIKVCDEWKDREKFYEWCISNGFSKGDKILRKDSEKGYFPNNCYFGKSTKKRGVKEKLVKNKEHRITMKKFAGIEGKYSDGILFRAYSSMHNRCENKNDPHYPSYGGRGISVDDSWSGKDGYFFFHRWSIENGWRKGLTLDRIDNNGNYSPKNCRWVTMGVQARNKRNSKCVEYRGLMLKMQEIADVNGIDVEKLENTYKEKQDIYSAVSICKNIGI